MVYLLPTKLTTTTNFLVLWTNMLREFDCSTWQAPSNGNYQFQFTVAGKNASSGGYNLSFDYIKFTPAVPAGPANQAPTNIGLSSSTVGENQPVGTAVGTLSTTDPDSGNTFAYALVSGTGSTDNGSFSISGATLQTAAVFNYEAQSSYNVRIRTTDQGGLYFEKAFVITVTNVNEAPTGIALSNSSVSENQPIGTSVGTFTTSDPDAGDTFTYSLVSGTGSTDNGSFTISGSTLQTAAVFDYETQNSYSIRVRSTDAGGLYDEKAFTISILNVNEPPFAPTNQSPADGAIGQPVAVTLSASTFADPDAGDTEAAAQWLVQRASDSVTVFDSGEDPSHKTSLTLAAGTLQFATTYSWQVRYEDSHSLWGPYSTATAFRTTSPLLWAAMQQGQLVLSWPTNVEGFVLESTTNFPATNWNQVLPAASLWGGVNVVTNELTGPQMFYRLHRP